MQQCIMTTLTTIKSVECDFNPKDKHRKNKINWNCGTAAKMLLIAKWLSLTVKAKNSSTNHWQVCSAESIYLTVE